jgi:hypothetical protein
MLVGFRTERNRKANSRKHQEPGCRRANRWRRIRRPREQLTAKTDVPAAAAQQNNNRAGENGERSSDANNNLWCPILGDPRFLAARGEARRRVLETRLYARCGQIEMRTGPAGKRQVPSLRPVADISSYPNDSPVNANGKSAVSASRITKLTDERGSSEISRSCD